MQLCAYRSLIFSCFASLFLLAPAVAQDENLGDVEVADASGKHWVLQFKAETVRMFAPREGALRGRVYWYMVYTLENKTGEDREFFVSINAKSDKGKKYSDVFLPQIERGIERKLGRTLWGQTDKFKLVKDRDPKDDRYDYTTIKAGEKRRCIAVFNKLDRNANNITFEVYGLSADFELLSDEDGNETVRERVLELRFRRPGDEYDISQDRFRAVDRSWVKKARKVKDQTEDGS